MLRVLYLIFNEGYAATAGATLQRTELSDEAIRLTRMMHASLPDNSDVMGLLALMLLTHARHLARCTTDGMPLPMADQDPTLWDQTAIADGIRLVSRALPHGPIVVYQVQAAIAAVHDEAVDAESTDWP